MKWKEIILIILLFSTVFSIDARESNDPSVDNYETRREHYRKSLNIFYGPAIYAQGGIIMGAGDALQLLEDLLNTGFLFSPEVSPVIEKFGPLSYKVPDYDIFSHGAGLEYLHEIQNSWYVGIVLQYSDLSANIDIPATYLNLAKFGFPENTFYQVSRKSSPQSFIVSIFQLDGVIKKVFPINRSFDLTWKAGLGMGRGWLAVQGKGPWAQSIHAITGIGLNNYIKDDLYIYCELNYTGYLVKTEPTSQIDYTRVLINPGKGDISLARLIFGVGYHLE